MAVTQQLLEFAVCYLEYSDVEKEDLSVQVDGFVIPSLAMLALVFS